MSVVTEEMIERAAVGMAGIAWVGAGNLERATWRTYAKDALAAVAPLIAKAERERCAREVDCGCLNRDAVLSAETKADRWRACPRDPCGAVEAAAIRALRDEG